MEEETGLEARLLGLSGMYRRRDGSLAYVFAARVGWQEIPKGERHEIAKRRWMSWRKALKRLTGSSRDRLLDALRRPSLFKTPALDARVDRLALRISAG